jgi:hypothetical protein
MKGAQHASPAGEEGSDSDVFGLMPFQANDSQYRNFTQ